MLEIGTGSGYQAAILAELAREVYTIEIVPQLAERAQALLDTLGYRNVHVRLGDGYLGWPELQPFDRIIVTAAPDHVPEPLVAQLAVNGRMVLPVGPQHETQKLVILTRTPAGPIQRDMLDVLFVPLVRKTPAIEEASGTAPQQTEMAGIGKDERRPRCGVARRGRH